MQSLMCAFFDQFGAQHEVIESRLTPRALQWSRFLRGLLEGRMGIDGLALEVRRLVYHDLCLARQLHD